MNEISFTSETKTVESKSIVTDWTWEMGEIEIGMSYDVYKHFVSKEKTINLIKRLKNRKL